MRAVAVFVPVLCYLAVAHAWTCREAPQHYFAVQIDAGLGQVVMTDRDNLAYSLSGSTWYRLGTARLKHVSVGSAGIWGVDASNRVYKYVSGNFVLSDGLSLRQVDAGGSGQVVGISTSNTAYCLKSTIVSTYAQVSVLSWDSLSRNLIYYSCGPLFGCWGTDAANRIYVTQRIIPNTCETSGWVVTDGAAKMAEVGSDGTVFVLNAQGSVFQRIGITSSAPQGTQWVHIPVCMPINHLTYDLGTLWLVTSGGTLMQCTQ
ncbi:fish-egg lectin-like [Channa argus]|uniref:fish-egg lectin-like n=1 Tax=Channa argus TaxID=215402 RepID=UPI003522DACC